VKAILLRFSLVLLLLSFTYLSKAQGPPIITDKPIMLGEKRVILKTLSRIENYEEGTYCNAPFMAHYILKPNLLFAAHLPIVGFSSTQGFADSGLGDVNATVKYQFYRKDGTGKTLRSAIKYQQFFPTGIESGNEEISTGQWRSNVGLTLGYEALRYGLGFNLGMNLYEGYENRIIYKGSVGLPLLPLVYPPKQLNLYFEYEGAIGINSRNHQLKFSQGIQYAIKRVTLEAAIQIPVIHGKSEDSRFKNAILIGSRFII